VIKPEPKGSNFGRTWFKLVPREPLAPNFINVRTGLEVLSKRKNWTTLVYWVVLVCFLTFMKNL
jgi:hypothetical protein